MIRTPSALARRPPRPARRSALALATALALAGGAIGSMVGSMTIARADAVIRSHGISTFGDLKYPSDFPHFDYVNPDAPQGGTMSWRGIGASATYDSLNNFILKGEAAQGLELLYDGLLVGASDEPDAAYGLVASAVEYPEDRSWVIFEMRPEARFSDGVPITAADVVFTYETLRDKGLPAYRIALQDVTGAEALGDHRVKFTFREGAATRDLPMLVGGLSILPKHYYGTVAFEDSTMVPPVGSGEFLIADAKPGRSIKYCKNPDYWARDLPVNVGIANFECYLYEYYGDYTAAFEALKSGQYLFHEEFSSKAWSTQYDFPALAKGWVKQLDLPDGRPSGTQGYWMNLRREKFQDPRVRQAIALMFNFEWSNAALFYGQYQRTDSFFENSPMAASGLPEGEELAVLERHRALLPAEIFTAEAYVPPVYGPQQLDRKAVRAASHLLDEAGWTVGPGGMRRNAKGETLSVEFLDDSPTMERVINPFVDNLRKIGVDARYTLVDAAQIQQRQEDFVYDILPARLSMSLSPSIELRLLFGSESAEAKGSYNLSGVKDPGVDALIEEIIASKTREDMEARVRALDRLLRHMQIWVPNWSKAAYWIAYWDVFGFPEKPPAFSRGDEAWWFDQAKYDKLRAEGALR